MSRRSKPPIAIYSALADATRCRIIEILRAGPSPVHSLAGTFSISRPAISRHLRVLKTAGLVAEVKKGRENLYALRPARLAAAFTWLETMAPAMRVQEVEASPAPALPPSPPREMRVRHRAASMPQPAIIVPQPPAPTPGIEKPARTEKPEVASQMGFDFG